MSVPGKRRASTGPKVSQLTPEQQALLTPDLDSLDRLTNFALLASCCTLCFSWLPYAIKARSVLKKIEAFEAENRRSSVKLDGAISDEGSLVANPSAE